MAEGGEMDENQNVHVSVFYRLASFPLIHSSYQIASFAYRDLKDVHPAVGYICELSERGVKSASDVAVSGVSPLLELMEPQVTAANNVALQLVDRLENRLPVLEQPADEVVSEFWEMLVNGVKAVKNRTLERVQNVLDRTQTVVRESYEVVSTAATFLEKLEVRDAVRVAAYFVVSQAEDLVERYLPEEPDTGGPESSSSSDDIDEIDGAKFSLSSRSQNLVLSIATRSLRKLRVFLDRYWKFLQSGVDLLLSIPAQVRRWVEEVLWSLLVQNTSKEANRRARKKKAGTPSRLGRSPANTPQSIIFHVNPNGRRVASGGEGGRVRSRERRRQSFDSSFYPSRIQEDVVDNVFNP